MDKDSSFSHREESRSAGLVPLIVIPIRPSRPPLSSRSCCLGVGYHSPLDNQWIVDASNIHVKRSQLAPMRSRPIPSADLPGNRKATRPLGTYLVGRTFGGFEGVWGVATLSFENARHSRVRLSKKLIPCVCVRCKHSGLQLKPKALIILSRDRTRQGESELPMEYLPSPHDRPFAPEIAERAP